MQTSDTSGLLRAENELILSQKEKAERTKLLGEPIELAGKALDIHISGNFAFVAENTTVARKVNLEGGKTVALYRGHTAPVTSLAFYGSQGASGQHEFMITGSWDKTIRIWNTFTKDCLSTTNAHSDFVKTLFVIPQLKLLVSGSSDKVVRFWDLSDLTNGQPLKSVGSVSAHTRPVEAVATQILSTDSAVLFTGDTMGVIHAWQLTKEADGRWKTIPQGEFTTHRTKINEMAFADGQLWTASTDETVQVTRYPPPQTPAPAKPLATITHPVAVRCFLPLSCTPLQEPYLITGAGDVIRTYDMSSMDEPELLSEVDAHWHDVTALRLWIRGITDEETAKTRVEPWIISTSLDGTIRKWKLSELLKPSSQAPKPELVKVEANPPAASSGLTEEEERELAELMGED